MYKDLITQEGVSKIKVNTPCSLQVLLHPFGIDASKLSTNSRESVVNEISRYCDIEKIKNRYRILYIYPEPKPSERKRRNDSFYPEHIDHLLPPGMSIMTKKELWEYVGMINKHYIPQYKKHEPAFEYFFNKTYEHFSQIILNALRNLKVSYTIEYMIVYSDHSRLAENADLDFILNIQNRVLEEFDCNSIRDIYRRHLDRAYYARCNQIYKVTFRCKYIYEVIKIERGRSVRYSGKRKLKQELNRRCYEWAVQIDPVLAKKYVLTSVN